MLADANAAARMATYAARARRGLRLQGTVQGIGLRSAVFRLARSLRVSGLVRNAGAAVWIEVEGQAPAVHAFVDGLHATLPALARIERLETCALPVRGDTAFRIDASEQRPPAGMAIPPDLAPCAACLRELADPADRRYRYPFVSCTACGPRYTIAQDLPYDRARTTMAPFARCDACRREYEDPADRRFRAEPTACPRCGPRLVLVRRGRRIAWADEALVRAAAAIGAGAIVAVKGVGGFVLAADATRDGVVQRLRTRKQRPHKPFAVMARDLAHVERIAFCDAAERAALAHPARPIVLLRRRPNAPLTPAVAPGLAEIGVCLPPTPLQHLLLVDGPPWQVMPSGNRTDEPIAKDDSDALDELAGIADLFLLHDRAIRTRADDSVVRVVAGAPVVLRRARGHVPRPLPMPVAGAPPVLAVGAQRAAVVCLARDGTAMLSSHLGHLRDPRAFSLFEDAIARLCALGGAPPAAVAHDLHPGYASTRWALASGLRCIPVQHHHAHVAACLAEHGRQGPVIGVAFDGTGDGGDGTAWGGELLLADLLGFTRRGHLRPLALAGGEAAIRQPWRLAVAALRDAGEALDLLRMSETGPVRRVQELLDRGRRTVQATGAGRWFDAVAALCGFTGSISYDGQAAIALESLAGTAQAAPLPFTLRERAGEPFEVDLRPAVRAIAADLRRGARPARIAARFHETVARVVVAACRRIRGAGGPALVALTGGCFQNRRLLGRTRALLAQDGYDVLVHHSVPPGDGGLCLGQAAVAARRLMQGK